MCQTLKYIFRNDVQCFEIFEIKIKLKKIHTYV